MCHPRANAPLQGVPAITPLCIIVVSGDGVGDLSS